MKPIKSLIPSLAILIISLVFTSFSDKSGKSGSDFGGVKIGVITYSWRSMPGSALDIINYCKQNGISSLELMGNVAEKFAGLPEENKGEWRLSDTPAEKYKELRTLFDDAGIHIHTVKFSPAAWSDEEIDYAFESAKILGADAVSNEIGHEACKRLGPFAEKHGMYATFHNHLQPGEPGFSFEEFLDYSSANMLNLDVGHYYGATGKHPGELIKKLHKRIYSIHLKDKTGPEGEPPNTNMPFGQGETPLEDILTLIRDNSWNIYCDIELEYPIPEDSDAVKETANCVSYCKSVLQ